MRYLRLFIEDSNINLAQNENNLRYNKNISHQNRSTFIPPTIHHFPTKSYPFLRWKKLFTSDNLDNAQQKRFEKNYRHTLQKANRQFKCRRPYHFRTYPGGIIERSTAPVVAELTLSQTATVRSRCWQRLKNCHARVLVLIFGLCASFEVGNYKINGRFRGSVLLEFSFD